MRPYLDAGEIEIANAAGVFSATATIHAVDNTASLGFYDADDECRTSAHLLDANPAKLDALIDFLAKVRNEIERRRANARQLTLIQGGMAA